MPWPTGSSSSFQRSFQSRSSAEYVRRKDVAHQQYPESGMASELAPPFTWRVNISSLRAKTEASTLGSMERVIYTPPTGPPQGPGPSKEIYSLMGEENIFRMMSDFYKELERSDVRSLFPPDMQA